MKFSEILHNTDCYRCSGTGQYLHYGICFRCEGAKRSYSNSATHALKEFHTAMTKPAGELVVGDQIRVNGITFSGGTYRYWARVTEVVDSEDVLRYTTYPAKDGGIAQHQTLPETTFERRGTSEERQTLLHSLAERFPKAFKPDTIYSR